MFFIIIRYFSILHIFISNYILLIYIFYIDIKLELYLKTEKYRIN